MRGDTTAIDVATLRIQWASHSSMAAICSYWTVSRDQLIRLRDVYELPKRHSRALRFKPERDSEPPAKEEAASLASLSLAPAVEVRAAEVRATWTDAQWLARYWDRPAIFSLPQIEAPCEFPDDDLDGLQG